MDGAGWDAKFLAEATSPRKSELLKFVVGMVTDHFVSKVFLELADESGGEARMVLERVDAVLPLSLEDGFAELREGWLEALCAKPLAERRLEGEVVSGLGGVEVLASRKIRRCGGS